MSRVNTISLYKTSKGQQIAYVISLYATLQNSQSERKYHHIIPIAPNKGIEGVTITTQFQALSVHPTTSRQELLSQFSLIQPTGSKRKQTEVSNVLFNYQFCLGIEVI